MKKFFKDFKAFISKGNILDMAVGVIIGTAFSAIVTALTNKIIMPFINWLLSLGGADEGLASAYTFLKKVYILDETGAATSTIDLTNSIYIDWGAFITAILNFFIIALTLFIILKVAMKSSGFMKSMTGKAMSHVLTKEEKKEMKELGIDRKDKDAVAFYLANKKAEEEKKKAEEEEKKRLEEEEKQKNSTEFLLREIRDLLKENGALKASLAEAKEENQEKASEN